MCKISRILLFKSNSKIIQINRKILQKDLKFYFYCAIIFKYILRSTE